jgi:hypothetical protein
MIMQYFTQVHAVSCEVHAVSCEVHAVSCEVHAVSCEVHAVSCEVHAVSCEVHAVAMISISVVRVFNPVVHLPGFGKMFRGFGGNLGSTLLCFSKDRCMSLSVAVKAPADQIISLFYPYRVGHCEAFDFVWGPCWHDLHHLGGSGVQPRSSCSGFAKNVGVHPPILALFGVILVPLLAYGFCKKIISPIPLYLAGFR